MYKLIIATGLNGEIGCDNKLLCHIKEDLAYFQAQTLHKAVVMGRKTHDSIKAITKCKRGLPNRFNYVLSHKGRGMQDDNYVIINDCNVMDEMAAHADVWVCGGKNVYEQFNGKVEEVHHTKINREFPEADCHFDMKWVEDNTKWHLFEIKRLTDDVQVLVYRKIK